jgi:hypothetical protein
MAADPPPKKKRKRKRPTRPQREITNITKAARIRMAAREPRK